jgi:NADH-quinone oxidoreductase subunit C
VSTTPVGEPAATNPNEESALLPVGTTELEIVDVRHGMFHGSGDTSGYAGLVRPVALPSATARPYGGWYDEAADTLAALLPDYAAAVDKVVVEHGDLTFHVRREHLVDFVRALRDDPALRFEMCASVSGVHYPHETGAELHAVYAFLSLTHNRRLRLEVTCPDEDPTIPSIMGVYPTADWHEREAFDFFGIVFTDRPDLTRIQMPDDWPGHPQRKDYPLGGIPVEYKGAEIPPPDARRAYSG